jgi:hypothetical protein
VHTSIFSLAAAIAIVIGVAAFAPNRAEAMAVPADLRAATGDSLVTKAWCRTVCGPKGLLQALRCMAPSLVIPAEFLGGTQVSHQCRRGPLPAEPHAH